MCGRSTFRVIMLLGVVIIYFSVLKLQKHSYNPREQFIILFLSFILQVKTYERTFQVPPQTTGLQYLHCTNICILYTVHILTYLMILTVGNLNIAETICISLIRVRQCDKRILSGFHLRGCRKKCAQLLSATLMMLPPKQS